MSLQQYVCNIGLKKQLRAKENLAKKRGRVQVIYTKSKIIRKMAETNEIEI